MRSEFVVLGKVNLPLNRASDFESVNTCGFSFCGVLLQFIGFALTLPCHFFFLLTLLCQLFFALLCCAFFFRLPAVPLSCFALMLPCHFFAYLAIRFFCLPYSAIILLSITLMCLYPALRLPGLPYHFFAHPAVPIFSPYPAGPFFPAHRPCHPALRLPCHAIFSLTLLYDFFATLEWIDLPPRTLMPSSHQPPHRFQSRSFALLAPSNQCRCGDVEA